MTSRAGWVGAAVGLLGLVVASTPVVPMIVLARYAPNGRPFQAADLPAARAIVVLGAGADRVIEAARVYRLLNQPWIISSGGDEGDRRRGPSAVLMRDALVRLGVPTERILLEAKSSTTRDEAVLVAPMLKTLGSPSFVLVTSRSHMPRAAAVFRVEGVFPVPAPSADFAPSPIRTSRWRPSLGGLLLSRRLVHEIVGFGYYRLRGWSTPQP